MNSNTSTYNGNSNNSNCNNQQNSLEATHNIRPTQTQILQNATLVHSILLSKEDDDTVIIKPFVESEFSSLHEFFSVYWKSFSSNSADESLSVVEEDFGNTLQPQQLVSQTMKRAFYDYAIEQASKNDDFNHINHASEEKKNTEVSYDRDFTPYISIIHKLYTRIKELVPNRTDLHPYLDCSKIKIESIDDMLVPLIPAAEALVRLEAPIRVNTTSSWLQIVQTKSITECATLYEMEKNPAEFAVSSVVFLLIKSDLCSIDIANTYIRQSIPYIRSIGVEYEQERFQSMYGSWKDGCCKVPHTKEWLSKMWVSSEEESDVICRGENYIEKVICSVAFVDQLLFTASRLSMPEIFMMDNTEIGQIRKICQAAVIGSSLALHACNAVSVSTKSISMYPLENNIKALRDRLTCAIVRKHKNSAILEDDVGNLICSLARELGTSEISRKQEINLRGICVSALRGTDPVLSVLDKRLRIFFRDNLKSQDFSVKQNIPGILQSGQKISIHSSSKTSKPMPSNMRRQRLIELACQQGFAFYADDIVTAFDMAESIIDLVWRNYGNDLLIPVYQSISKEYEWID